MATLWHVVDLLELICEFDDSPTHLTTLRRVSWSFHRAVENVWTLLLGRQNSVIGDEQLDSIARWYSLAASEFSDSAYRKLVRAVRAALTALRHTVTSVALPWHGTHEFVSELAMQLIDMPRLQSTKFLGEEWLLKYTAQFGTSDQLATLLHRCPHLLDTTSCLRNTPALLSTARNGNLESALVLLRYVSDSHVKNAIGDVSVHVACKQGHHQYLEGIINAGYDVDLSAIAGGISTPAHAALPHPSTLQFLIDRGANVNIATYLLGTPAFCAAFHGAAESLRILIAAGVDVESTSTHGCTVAMAGYKHPACLDVLGNAGVDLNAVDPRNGETVAHRAAREGQLESLRVLHKHGANLCVASRAGETPEQLAARRGFTECVTFLARLRLLSAPSNTQH
jgi:ankyrin repeat protein